MFGHSSGGDRVTESRSAPSPSVILELPFVPVTFNGVAVGRYLMAREQVASGTYFEGISRVLPDTRQRSLQAGPSTTSSSPYRRERRSGILFQAVAGFKERFLEGVRARMQDATDLACELSGGLDSASVAGAMQAVSPGTPFPTFSLGFPDEERDLTFATRFSEWAGLDNEVVDTSLIWDRRRNAEIFGELGSPLTIDGPLFQGATMFAASTRGTRTLLTGVDGDATAMHGYAYITELLLAHDFGSLAKNDHGGASCHGNSEIIVGQGARSWGLDATEHLESLRISAGATVNLATANPHSQPSTCDRPHA